MKTVKKMYSVKQFNNSSTGDNVGDVAGMGADLFASLSEATCASLVIIGGLKDSTGKKKLILFYPIAITIVGLVSGFVSLMAIRFCRVRKANLSYCNYNSLETNY